MEKCDSQSTASIRYLLSYHIADIPAYLGLSHRFVGVNLSYFLSVFSKFFSFPVCCVDGKKCDVMIKGTIFFICYDKPS